MDRHRIPAPKDQLSDEQVREFVVAEVLRDQEAKAQAWRVQSRKGTTRGRIAAALVLCVAAVYVWYGGPSWADPPPAPVLPAVQEEAGLRLAVTLQMQRILDFRREQGRLPDVLWETGEPLPGILYQRIDARTFRLTGVGSQGPVHYVAGDSLGIFVAPARPLLGQDD